MFGLRDHAKPKFGNFRDTGEVTGKEMETVHQLLVCRLDHFILFFDENPREVELSSFCSLLAGSDSVGRHLGGRSDMKFDAGAAIFHDDDK